MTKGGCNWNNTTWNLFLFTLFSLKKKNYILWGKWKSPNCRCLVSSVHERHKAILIVNSKTLMASSYLEFDWHVDWSAARACFFFPCSLFLCVPSKIHWCFSEDILTCLRSTLPKTFNNGYGPNYCNAMQHLLMFFDWSKYVLWIKSIQWFNLTPRFFLCTHCSRPM